MADAMSNPRQNPDNIVDTIQDPESGLSFKNAQTSATALRYELALAELRREYFCRHPKNLAESIAKHYTAHAVIALHLLELIKLRESYGEFSDKPIEVQNLDYIIKDLTEIIKRNHLHDFGTPLIEITQQPYLNS